MAAPRIFAVFLDVRLEYLLQHSTITLTVDSKPAVLAASHILGSPKG
jgi:hypothetical protein